MRGCALLPSSDMCAGSLGDAAQESRHPGDAREGAAADSLSAAGRACTAVAYSTHPRLRNRLLETAALDLAEFRG